MPYELRILLGISSDTILVNHMSEEVDSVAPKLTLLQVESHFSGFQTLNITAIISILCLVGSVWQRIIHMTERSDSYDVETTLVHKYVLKGVASGHDCLAKGISQRPWFGLRNILAPASCAKVSSTSVHTLHFGCQYRMVGHYYHPCRFLRLYILQV